MHEQELELSALLVEHLTHWFPHLISKPITILDFGCGSGLMANFVQRAFYKSTVYATDSDNKSLKQAKELFPQLNYFVMQDNKIPFEDNFFDLIYAANVFHHIPREKHRNVCDELLRVLKPSGTLIIVELNQFNIKTYLNFKRNPDEKNTKLIPFWCWYFILLSVRISHTFFPGHFNYSWGLSTICFWRSLYAIEIKK